MRYRFHHFLLDADNFALSRDGAPIAIEPMVFDLLLFLVQRAGSVVTRDALVARVWKGRVVSDAAIAGTVKAARRCLGDSGATQRFIRTVHGRGFQFVGELTVDGDGGTTDLQATAHVEGAGITATVAPSIAVLPFVALQPTPALTLIGDALAQDVILDLSRLHWLRVIARGSSFRFRGSAVDVAQAGEILGARYVLCGTLVADGTRCALTVELSHASDAKVVWAQRHVIELQEVMHLRSRVAGEIAGVLETRIPFSEALQASTVATTELDAWSAYHRGLWHMFRFDARDNDTATQLFRLALQRDANFARAEAGLSFTHFQNAFLGFSSDVRAERDAARQHAERACLLDPLDPFARLTMGRSEWLHGNVDTAITWCEQAIDLNPNYALALYNHALLQAFTGDAGRSERNVMRAIDLSPIDPLNHAMLATRALAAMLQGAHDAAAQWALRAERQPGAHVHIRAISVLAHEIAGRSSAARACAARIRREQPGYNAQAFLHYFLFRDEGVRARIEDALARSGL